MCCCISVQPRLQDCTDKVWIVLVKLLAHTPVACSSTGRCWLDPAMPSCIFVYISLVLLPSAVSLHCLKQIRWQTVVSSSAAVAQALGKERSCTCEPFLWVLLYSSSGNVVISEGWDAPWVHCAGGAPGKLLLSFPCIAGCVPSQMQCASLHPWGRSDNHRLLMKDTIVLLYVPCREKGTPQTPILNPSEQQILRLWDCCIQLD